MLQCAVEYQENSAAEKEEFLQAYLVDEAIIKSQNQCIAKSQLSPDNIITINDSFEAGTEA